MFYDIYSTKSSVVCGPLQHVKYIKVEELK